MRGFNVECCADIRALSDLSARFIAGRIRARIESAGKCSIALAGGNTPRSVYRRLAEPGLADQVDWSKVLIRWGDERCVPSGSEQSNYKMAKETLLDHVPLLSENIARIKSELPMEQATRLYADEIGGSRLDIVLLGLGKDGHTASLFPGTKALKGDSRKVVATSSPVPPTGRVSLSLGAINQARTVVFLVTGDSKSEILGEVFRERLVNDPRLPAAMVRPTSGELIWFVDEAAAARICSEKQTGKATDETEN